MKRASFLLSLLFASTLPAAAADRLEQWYNLMPKNTAGVIAIKNAPELLADWEKSGHAKFMESDEAKRWMAPMHMDGEAPWDKFFKDTYGGSMHDTLQNYPGALVRYLVIDDLAEAGKSVPYVSLYEIGGRQKEVEAHRRAEVEAKKKKNADIQMRTEDIGGVSVQAAAASGADGAPWVLAWAVVGDVMIEANTHELMEYMIGALKNNAGDPPGVQRGHLTRIEQLTHGGGDMLLYVNGVRLLELSEEALAAGDDEKAGGGLLSSIKPKQIMDLVGAEELQAIAFTAELTDKQSCIDITILHPQNATGLLSLMHGSENAVGLPPFVPSGTKAASVLRLDFGQVYDALLGMVGRLGPLGMLVTMQIPQYEKQMGFKIREDLFGSLADEAIHVNDGEGSKESHVVGIKIKDADKLVGALEGLKRYLGAGFGAFEESDYLGFPINTLKVSSYNTEISYCDTGKYLLISTGKQDTLKKILGRMKDPSGPSLWDDGQVQNLLALAPKNYDSVGVTDASHLISTLISVAATLESKVGAKAAKKKKGPGKKGPGADEGAPRSLNHWFDPTANPSRETFQRYFGSLLSTRYSHPDAIQFHYLTAPVEAQ